MKSESNFRHETEFWENRNVFFGPQRAADQDRAFNMPNHHQKFTELVFLRPYKI